MGWSAGVCLAAALLVSCGLQCFVCVAQELKVHNSSLLCGITDMQLSLPSLIKDTFVLSAVDEKGELHVLNNNSACGTWIGQNPDGSVVVGAAYDGCYISQTAEHNVMTILAENIQMGQVQYHKEELKCPLMPAMDAPSPSECAAIQQEDRLSCANPPVSRDLCERLGCCFSSTDSTLPCYFGNKVTAQCTAANNVRVAISKEVTSPSLRLDSVHVLGVDQTSCREFTISKTNSFIMFKFPLSCGSMKQMEDDVILYENTFEASREIRTWRGNSITRDSTMKLTVRCSYPRTGIVPLLKVEVFTLPPPLPFSTSGPLLLEMRIARDSEYNSYYGDGDYPVVKVLRDPVFLEVRILQRTDPSLILVLNQCWATPSLSSTQTPQWPVLEDRCPYTGDNYLTRLIPVPDSAQNVNFPSHYKRFSISTFTFVDERTQLSLGGLVYFHCSASVCVPSASESCMARCAKRKRRMMETLVSEDLMRNLVTSNGPVYFTGDRKKSSIHIKGDGMFDHSIMEWVRGAAAAGGILVVVLAVMALWKYRQNKRTTVKF